MKLVLTSSIQYSIFFGLVFLFCSNSNAQTLRKITRLPRVLEETSGIEETGKNQIWTFNDSGGEPALYLIDTLGNIVRTVQIENSWNRDWEDITKDDKGNFYIGNIGNNNNNNTDLTIFKIPDPSTVQGSSIQAEIISFSYQDQQSFPPASDSLNFDCETLMWFNGNLYLSSKNRTVPFDGKTHLYRLPDEPGSYVAEKISTFDTGGSELYEYWVTAGDISPDGSKLCLLSGNRMWLFYDFQGDDFFNGQNIQINFSTVTQKEALCFVSENEVYITDEGWPGRIGRNLYSVDFKNLTILTPTTQSENAEISIFPNPAGESIIIEGNLRNYRLEILDMNGSSHQKINARNTKVEINTSNFPNGLIFIKIRNKSTGVTQLEKVIKL